jgi:hypothetical protein
MKAVKISAKTYYKDVEDYKRAIERLWDNVKNAVTRDEYEAAVVEYEYKKERLDYYTSAYVPALDRA